MAPQDATALSLTRDEYVRPLAGAFSCSHFRAPALSRFRPRTLAPSGYVVHKSTHFLVSPRIRSVTTYPLGELALVELALVGLR